MNNVVWASVVLLLCGVFLGGLSAVEQCHEISNQPLLLKDVVTDEVDDETLLSTPSERLKQQDRSVFNYHKVFAEATEEYKDKPVKMLQRYRLPPELAQKWVIRVKGNCGFEIYYGNKQIASAPYQRGLYEVCVLELNPKIKDLNIIVKRPANKDRWLAHIQMGQVLSSITYNNESSAFMNVVTPAKQSQTLQLHNDSGLLCSFSDDPDKENVHCRQAAVPFRQDGSHYKEAWLTLDGRRLFAMDLSEVNRLQDFEAQTEAGIKQHRTGLFQIQTLPGAKVTIEQVRHDFHFGSMFSGPLFYTKEEHLERVEKAKQRLREKNKQPSFMDSLSWDEYQQVQKQYRDIAKTYFNSSVHGNALKWYHVNRKSEKSPNYTLADRVLAFCQKHDIHMRGHTLFWDVPKYTRGWRKEKLESASKEEVERMIQARAIGQTYYYRGKIDEWDLNNEMVHGRYYRDLVGDEIIRKMADWARVGNPDAKLYVNDFAILNAHDGDKYLAHIKELQAQGVQIDGIGCQAHFWRPSLDVYHIRETLNKLATLNLPIKATEFDIGGTDQQQRRSYTGFYRTLFAHPQVEAIIMWGFWAGRHWRHDDAPWRKDFSPRPAAEEYIRLTTQLWNTQWQGTADESGVVEVPNAFYGTYKVVINGEETLVQHAKPARGE